MRDIITDEELDRIEAEAERNILLVKAARREKLFRATLQDLAKNYDEDPKYDHCPIRKATETLAKGEKL